MAQEGSLLAVTDQVVKDIALQVAKLEISPQEEQVDLPEEDCGSLVIDTKGDYELTLVFSAGQQVLRAISNNMIRGLATDEDIPVCAVEFFNILSGRVISAINNRTHSVARFAIPRLVNGVRPVPSSDKDLSWWVLNYSTPYGPVKVQAGYRPRH